MQTYSVIYLQCFTRKITKVEAASIDEVVSKLKWELINSSMITSIKNEQGVQLWEK